ncbi:hypothetical protein AgCh_017141 [Apium graveolens]
MLEEYDSVTGVINIGDWIPWINFLDLQGYIKRMKALRKKFDRFYDHLAHDQDSEFKPNPDQIKGLTHDLITGGTDTSALTIEWALSELLQNPETIKKAAEEINQVIGTDRWVEEKDLPQLSYLESIVKETMRLHPVASILPPHFALETCEVAGYNIHKGTTVFINIWSIGRDKTLWDDAEKFCPERFLRNKIC